MAKVEGSNPFIRFSGDDVAAAQSRADPTAPRRCHGLFVAPQIPVVWMPGGYPDPNPSAWPRTRWRVPPPPVDEAAGGVSLPTLSPTGTRPRRSNTALKGEFRGEIDGEAGASAMKTADVRKADSIECSMSAEEGGQRVVLFSPGGPSGSSWRPACRAAHARSTSCALASAVRRTPPGGGASCRRPDPE